MRRMLAVALLVLATTSIRAEWVSPEKFHEKNESLTLTNWAEIATVVLGVLGVLAYLGKKDD